MIGYSFLTQIDKFRFVSGKCGVLIIGTHAFNDSNMKFPNEHPCDYAVSPILKALEEFAPNSYYILENMVAREVIDMNRSISRWDDPLDENDQLFRQFIHFTCQYLIYKYQRLPLVIDLHSFDTHPYWGNNDIMLLIQEKERMQTDEALLFETKSFFKKRGYNIDSSTIHNQDDIVEQIKFRNLGNPILMEINESFLESDQIEEFTRDFIDFLDHIDKMNEIKPLLKRTDNINPIDLKYYNIKRVMKDLSSIDLIKDKQLRDAYLNFLKRLGKKDIAVSKGDSIDSISQLTSIIPMLSQSGEDFDSIICNVIETLSNENDSILIPYELIFLLLEAMYNNINRIELKEYGLTSGALEYTISKNFLKRYYPNSIRPIFNFDPFEKWGFVYQSYPEQKSKVNFIILLDKIEEITPNGLVKDSNILNDLFKTKINLKDLKSSSKALLKLEDGINLT